MEKIRTFYSKYLLIAFGILYILGDVIFSNVGFNGVLFERKLLFIFFIASSVSLFAIPKLRLKASILKDTKNFIFFTPIIVCSVFYYIIITYALQDFIAIFNRSARSNPFFSSMIYVLMDAFIKTTLVYLFYYFKYFTKNKKRIFFLFVLLVIGVDVFLLGARRTSFFLVVGFIGSVYLDFSIRKKVVSLLLLLAIGVGFFLLGGYREFLFSGKELNGNLIEYTSQSNEFELVTRSADDFIGYAKINGYNYGLSLIYWPLYFVPRYVWPSKPMGEGRDKDIFASFFGEAYYNFGYFSFFYIISIFFIIVYLVRQRGLISLLMFCFIPELFRTSISEYIFTLLISIFILHIFLSISKLKLY